MLTSLFSQNTSAKAPDFTKAKTYTLDLSGAKFNITIPGNLDTSYPFSPVREKVNVFDEGVIRKQLIDRNWSYSGYFWQGEHGSLGLIVGPSKRLDNSDQSLFDAPSLLIKSLEHNLKRVYEAQYFDLSTTKINIVDVNKHQWVMLEAPKLKAGDRSEYISYHLPIFDNYYISLRFSVLPGDIEDYPRWYEQCKQDIQQIVESVLVIYPN